MDKVASRLRQLEIYWPVLVLAGGLVAALFGVWLWRQEAATTQVEVITGELVKPQKLLVDIQGGVSQPGVYELPADSRLKDAIIVAGGLSEKADRKYLSKTLNLAQKVSDGLKIYIPLRGETSLPSSSTLININTASVGDLDRLPGVGEARAKTIVDNRPYTQSEDLVEKKIVSASVFAKIKDLITVY